MPIKKRKSYFIQIVSSKLFIITGIAVLIFLGTSLSKEIIRRVEVSKKINSLKAEISNLQHENTELAGFIDYLKSESFQESQARLKLGLKKEGEKVIILPKAEESEGEADEEETLDTKVEAEKTPTEKWWDYFFK